MPLYHALERYDGYRLKTILLQKGITPVDLSKCTEGRISMSNGQEYGLSATPIGEGGHGPHPRLCLGCARGDPPG